MTSIQELESYLEEYLESSSFNDLCFNGVQVEGTATVKRLAAGVTASLATIEAAVEWQADALLVHHGLFWDGVRYQFAGSMRRKMKLLLEHGISLLAYHLPLDAHREVGNNWVAAHDLGLVNLHSFGEFRGQPMGVRGELPPTSIEEWVTQVEAYYGQPARAALGGGELVSAVAILSGGAHRDLPEAAALKLDCFITGTGDEPNWHTAYEEGIHFLALGHAATERIGPRALEQHLAKKFSLETTFLEDNNPF